MKHIIRNPGRSRTPRTTWSFITTAALLALSLCLSLQAALPTPLVDLRFSEGSGTTANNAGSLGGSAALVQPDEYPLFTDNVPTGVFAPSGNAASLDFGAIAANQGGRAADLTAASGDGTLGSLNAFTICGWLNARDLTEGGGGNRIAFALASENGPGFDLVQLANGALRIGINQWPDGDNGGGPASSTGMITADPQTGAGNWVFFAVTYDPSLDTGNLKYHFGNPTALASLRSAHNYKGGLDNGGVIELSGMLTIGNFGDVVGARNDTGPNGSRVFRGLVDELRIYDRALDLAEVQQAQLNGILPSVPVTIAKQPAAQTVFAGQPATFNVQVTGAAPFTYQWQRGTVDIPGETNGSYTLPATTSGDSGATFRVKVGNPVVQNILSDPATLTVLSENGHKISLSFSDGGGIVTNLGNLGGDGIYAISGLYPTGRGNVPAGPFAPASNLASVDFGVIGAGQGGRAIDLTNAFGNTVGPMQGFTLAGWLNCENLQVGPGGNRILFNLDAPGGNGFDLVQYPDGSLYLGVNNWADGGGNPVSSPMITADPSAGPANWVFFAVTYDGTLTAGNVNYYFGSPTQAAALDVAPLDYNQGLISTSGTVTVGNFSDVVGDRNATGSGNSRCFQGLIDEINVYNKVLSLSDIQSVQTAPAYQPSQVQPVAITADPQSQTVFAGQSATFQVSANGTQLLLYQWWTHHAGTDSLLARMTNAVYTLTDATAANSGDQYWAVVANTSNSVTSQKALLTVLPENNHKVFLSFSEGPGTTTANLGNIGGLANIVQQGGFPAFTNAVPVGPFAPANNTSSLNVGVIGDADGGRAVDLTGSVTPTIGSMVAFTVTGWLNCQDLRCGGGGNRILICQSASGQGGFDLAQNADGTLWMGVNTWPDGNPNSPARSNPVLTEDPAAGNANWVFFAFTYDGSIATGNANYYFGKPDQAATLDSTFDFDAGPISNVGTLSVDNFSTLDPGARNGTGPNGGSRCFRGLMDELNVFNRVLSLAELQAVQTAAAGIPVQPVRLAAAAQGNQVAVTWDSTATWQLQYRTDAGQGTWTDETTAPVANGTHHTVTVPMSGPARFYRLISR